MNLLMQLLLLVHCVYFNKSGKKSLSIDVFFVFFLLSLSYFETCHLLFPPEGIFIAHCVFFLSLCFLFIRVDLTSCTFLLLPFLAIPLALKSHFICCSSPKFLSNKIYYTGGHTAEVYESKQKWGNGNNGAIMQ